MAVGATRRRRGEPRLAGVAPVGVFVALGIEGERHLTRLRADHRLRVVPSPRHADLLLIAGALPRRAVPALHAVHDQVPPPRGVGIVGVAGDLAPLELEEVTAIDGAEPAPALRDLHGDVLAGRRGSATRGPGQSPVPWRGVGPHGQGGEGMMGGTPYGRPMAMPPVEGRDGLALDRLALRLGPFLPGLPAGVAMNVGLQGDVLAEARLEVIGTDDDGGLVGTPTPDPRPAAEREAGRRLGALAELCALAGLDAVARRAARVALAPTADGIRRLRRRVDRRWALRAATDGIGELASDELDVTGRWRCWLDEAVAVMEGGTPDLSSGRPLDAEGRAGIGEELVGLEVGQALLTVASLRPRLGPQHAGAAAEDRA